MKGMETNFLGPGQSEDVNDNIPESKRELEKTLRDLLPEEMRHGVESAARELKVTDWEHHPIKLAKALNPDGEPHPLYPDTATKFLSFLEEKGILVG